MPQGTWRRTGRLCPRADLPHPGLPGDEVAWEWSDQVGLGGITMGLNLGVRGLATILPLASLPTAGCSWLFVNKPPPQPVPASPPVECMASQASPVVDTSMALALAVGGVATMRTSPSKSAASTFRDCGCPTPNASLISHPFMPGCSGTTPRSEP
jgi:hypothetical protein